jgi:hypothetical protein
MFTISRSNPENHGNYVCIDETLYKKFVFEREVETVYHIEYDYTTRPRLPNQQLIVTQRVTVYANMTTLEDDTLDVSLDYFEYSSKIRLSGIWETLETKSRRFANLDKLVEYIENMVSCDEDDVTNESYWTGAEPVTNLKRLHPDTKSAVSRVLAPFSADRIADRDAYGPYGEIIQFVVDLVAFELAYMNHHCTIAR